MKSKQHPIKIFSWEILLIFLWSRLQYYALFKIHRGQDLSWECSIELDCDPNELEGSENLAETFIGKLFSKN
jgi:hypothetical protein